MGKTYYFCIPFLLILLLGFHSVFGQTPQKLVLNPSMVTNESSYGDAGMLVDEQTIANDPLNGSAGKPSTNWFPGFGDRHPVSAYIDLGGDFALSYIYLYDINGIGDFVIEHGAPGNWNPLLTESLIGYQVWKQHQVSITTRYLRFTRVTGQSNAPEIVLYGSAVLNAPPVLAAIGNQAVDEAESLSINLSSTDADNDPLAYSLNTSAGFITLTDNGNSTASLAINPGAGTAGNYTASVSVTDGNGGTDTETFTVTVNPVALNNPNKISLAPSMIFNESGLGDPGMLVDEQALAGDPQSGTGGAPETLWFPGFGDVHPVSAYIDLGESYDLSHIYLYDLNGAANFIIEYGEPGNWQPLLTEGLIGYMVWKAHNVAVSTRYLRFTRTSGSANTTEIVLYGSIASNAAPVLTAIGDQSLEEGKTLALNLAAIDADNDALAYSLNTTAGFIALTDNGNSTASLAVNPGSGTAGDYTATVSVTDGNGGTDTETFTVTVNPVAINNPNKISLAPSMITNESGLGDPGMLVDEQALAGDPQNGTGGAPETLWFPGFGDVHPVSAYIDLGESYDLSNIYLYDINGAANFIIESGAPGDWRPLLTEGLIGYMVWKELSVDVNTRYLRFTRTTGDANTTEIVLYGSVASNAAPVLTAIGDQEVVEGESKNFNISANDPDGDPLTFLLNAGVDFISMSDIGDGTAVLSVNPTLGSAGDYPVSVTVSDNNGGQDLESFIITVKEGSVASPSLQIIGIDFLDNRTNTPLNWNGLTSGAVGGSIPNLQNQSETNTGYSVVVTDNFNGTGLSGLTTGNNSGPVPDDVMASFWYNQHNQGVLKFTLDKTKKYTFRFYGGRNGTADDKSADYSIGNQTVNLYNFFNTENEAIIENVIPDANNEVLVTVKNSTGFTYAILNGMIIEEYAGASGNTAPVLTTIGNQTLSEGGNLELAFTATDEDNDPLTYSLTTTASFLTLTDHGDGTAGLKIAPGYMIAGVYEATITVKDGNGGEDSETFTIAVDSNPGGVPQAGDFRTKSSGDWHDYTVWQKYEVAVNNWVDALAGELPLAETNVFIEKDHGISLIQAAMCKDLNLSGNEDVRRLDIGTNLLEVWGQLRVYSGPAPGEKIALGYETSPPGHFIYTEENSQGRLKFKGSTPRVILPSVTGGASDALSGWTMEFAFDEGVTGTMDASLRMGNLIVSSGILQFNNSSLRPSGWQLENATGELLIKNGAKLKGGSGGFYKGSNTAMNSFRLEEGGFLEVTDPNFTLSAQTVNMLGTVIYSGTGNQSLLGTGGRNFSAPIDSYNNLIVDNGGVKSLRNDITLSGTLQKLNGATLDLNGFQVNYIDEGLVPDAIEYQALVDLYNNTSGYGWINETNWLQGNTSEDFNNWYGITVENGDVTEISLFSNYLMGDIPESIGNLSQLTYLGIAYNFLMVLPQSIGNLSNLNGLYLSSNIITSLPESIGNLINLDYIYVDYNNLTSLPESIGNLSNLSSLLLTQNNLMILPESIGNLDNLSELLLSNNYLKDLPESTKNLQGLSYLNLSNNRLRFGAIEPFFTSAGEVPFNFQYAPQEEIVEAVSVSYNHNNNAILEANMGGENNVYQWQYNNGTTWDPIPFAENKSYIVPASTSQDIAQYRCYITNTWVTGLHFYAIAPDLLTSNQIVINTLGMDGYNYQLMGEGVPADTYASGDRRIIPLGEVAGSNTILLSILEGDQNIPAGISFEVDNTGMISNVQFVDGMTSGSMDPSFYEIVNENEIRFITDGYKPINSNKSLLNLQNGLVMSPDGDGAFDVLEIMGFEGSSSFNLTVLDLNGEIVFQSASPTQSWDGTDARNSELADRGTYKYKVTNDAEVFEGQFVVDYVQ